MIDKLQIGSGRWEVAKFNERYQVTEMSLGTSPTDTSLWKINYEYGETDSNGNVDLNKNTGSVARQTISFAGLTESFVQTYKYDSLYRITEARETQGATQNWKQTWGYDRFGNRTQFARFAGATELANDAHSFPSIDPATNRFNPNQGYGYDKNGNLITNAEGFSVIFNGENKQSQVLDENNQPIGRYEYDGEGRRVRKVTDLETTVFVYDASSKLIAEYSNQTPENPNTSYVATDTLLSVRLVTDRNGNVVSRRDFQPFGEELTADGLARKSADKYSTATQDKVRQRFTGYQKDIETGLDFAEARMYENRHARFTAVDPLLASGKSANPQTFNRYTYVMNSPLVNTDPTGLQTNQEPEDQSGSIDGGTSRACQYFGFACRVWTWVKEKTCYDGDCVTTRTQIPSSTSPSQDGRNFLNNFTNTEAENLGERKQGNIFVPSPSAPRRSFAPFGTPESVENAERLFEYDPSGVLPWANSMRKLEEGRGSRFDVAINSVNVLTNIIPGGKPTKSVGLGVERIGGRLVLEELTEKTGATIYKNWAKEGLTSRTVENRFGRAFNQAVSRADEIHFALDGLIDDLPGALDRGRRFGFSVPRRNVTNAELFTIANNPDLLRKTTFYVNNRPIPSPFW